MAITNGCIEFSHIFVCLTRFEGWDLDVACAESQFDLKRLAHRFFLPIRQVSLINSHGKESECLFRVIALIRIEIILDAPYP